MTALNIGLHVVAAIIHIFALARAIDMGAALERLTVAQFYRRLAGIGLLTLAAITLQVLA
jgi:hypothetical protein